MKLLCVTNKHYNNTKVPAIEVGSEYTAIRGKQFSNGLFYELAEFPPEVIDGIKRIYFYHSKGFAILPDQSSDEMSNVELKGDRLYESEREKYLNHSTR